MLGSGHLSSATAKQKFLASVGIPQARRLIRQSVSPTAFTQELQALLNSKTLVYAPFWLKLHLCFLSELSTATALCLLNTTE